MFVKPLLLVAGLAGVALLAPSSSPATAPAVEAASAAKTYDVDRVHSAVIFRVMHLGTAWNFGRFNEFSGSIRFDEEKPENSSVEIEVAATSVDTANRGRDDHLRGSDFFESKQFPTITFKSTQVKALGTDRYELSGDLTLRGTSKPITFEIQKTGEGRNRQGKALIGFYGEFQVDRLAHGVSYMPDGLGKDVFVTVSLEAAQRD